MPAANKISRAATAMLQPAIQTRHDNDVKRHQQAARTESHDPKKPLTVSVTEETSQLERSPLKGVVDANIAYCEQFVEVYYFRSSLREQ